MKNTLLSLILLIASSACVSYDKFDADTVEGSFGLAKELSKDSRFEEALLQFQSIKNNYPYSKYATESELEIAEVHFKKEAFPEAQNAFELFKELHPKHPRIDYVTYRIAESIYSQLPSTIDRDLVMAPQAIRNYKLVGQEFPQSQWVAPSQERLREIYGKLAEKELYVADFYFRTEKYKSAIVRYEKFIREFPLHEKAPHALYQMGVAANIDLNNKKRDMAFKTLMEKHPQSPEALRAQKGL